MHFSSKTITSFMVVIAIMLASPSPSSAKGPRGLDVEDLHIDDLISIADPTDADDIPIEIPNAGADSDNLNERLLRGTPLAGNAVMIR